MKRDYKNLRWWMDRGWSFCVDSDGVELPRVMVQFRDILGCPKEHILKGARIIIQGQIDKLQAMKDALSIPYDYQRVEDWMEK